MGMHRMLLAISWLSTIVVAQTYSDYTSAVASLGGTTACTGAGYCASVLKDYAGDMPSKHPALLDTIPALTHPPSLGQLALPMASAANTVHLTMSWKCDSQSASSALMFPALASELGFTYLEQGNPIP